MSIKWDFKIDLMPDSFEKVEKILGGPLPKELQDFIRENNAASPDKNQIIVNGVERVLDSVISFNEEETDAATFKSVFRAIGNKQMIPFASDPFGNYFCYSLESKNIAYYEHEENTIEETDYSLSAFLDSLS